MRISDWSSDVCSSDLSDIVLPTASWYEKDDLNTSDMHPFIHPLSAAVDPVWESRSDWDIYKGIAKKFSEVAPEVLGVEHDVVLTPIQHDSPDRKSVVKGKSVSVRVDLGGSRIIKKKKQSRPQPTRLKPDRNR